MSNDGFLKRWSRRKRAPEPEAEREAAPGNAAETTPSKPAPDAGSGVAPPRSGGGPVGISPPADPRAAPPDDDAFDPATLPPLESLGPDSDYTVFLRKGVPETLRIAALRKAWMSDPFIRDFRGPAEYALDYTTAEFNLRPTDDVAKMLERIFPPKPAETEVPSAAAPAHEGSRAEPASPNSLSTGKHAPDELSLPQKQAEPARPQEPGTSAAPQPVPARRKHGGALPDESIDIS